MQLGLRVERAGAERRAIGRAENIEIGALGAGVGEIENPILAERSFGAERPDLRVAVFIIRIDAAAIGDGAGGRETVFESENLRAGCVEALVGGEGRFVAEILLGERVVDGFVVEDGVAAADDSFRFDESGLPGEADARSPVAIVAVNQRARIWAGERAGLSGSDDGDSGSRGVEIEIGDLIVFVHGRSGGFVAQAVEKSEMFVHAPVVLRVGDGVPAAEINVGAELDRGGVRKAEEKIGEFVVWLGGGRVGDGLAAGVELRGQDAGEIKLAAGLRAGFGVELNAAEFATEGEGVGTVYPFEGVGEAQRLIADERGSGIVERGEAGEIDGGNSIGERVGGDAVDAEVAGDVVDEGIVAEDLSTGARPIELRIFDEIWGPVVSEAEGDGLAEGGGGAGGVQKIAERILALRIQVVATGEAEF